METQKKGLSLLGKKEKTLGHFLFSRSMLVAVLFCLQIFVLFGIFRWFYEVFPYIFGASTVISAFLVLYVINTNIDPTAKITWLILLMITPVFGVVFYVYLKSDLGHRLEKKRVEQLQEETKDLLVTSKEVETKIQKENAGVAGLQYYLQHHGHFCMYQHTKVTYYKLGEEKWKEMLTQLELAKEFIYLEYFIIEEGLMWGNILEILSRKVKEGVEVKVLYDGTCEYSTLPHDYPKRLGELGIECKMFAPLTPFISSHYNYRDHRKIMVIDGTVAFTGGVNLADEYINQRVKFGHWKDVAVKLEGEGVKSFYVMFLQMWYVTEKEPDFKQLLEEKKNCWKQVEADGFVIPYGDCPLDEEKVGERVYMDMLNRANSYVYIYSPYLILDSELETAIKFASERGVEIHIILPGIPDKKLPYSLAKTHYPSLLASNVHLYEYTPGFVHGKMLLVDGREAVVGTINLDYRSLYHHFECGVYMYQCDELRAMEKDFIETRKNCHKVQWEDWKKEKMWLRLLGFFAKTIAPLI